MNSQNAPTIAIIGSGRVASALASHFKKYGIKITGIHSRNLKTGTILAQDIGTIYLENSSELKADILLVSVNDDETCGVIEKIPKDQAVIYTAGSVDLKSLQHKNCGVFYPLQTFGLPGDTEPKDFPVLLESENHNLLKDMVSICETCQLKHTSCTSEKRKEYHLVAVMLNNFVNHIVHLSQEQSEKRGLDWRLLNPLLKKTFDLLKDQKYNVITTPLTHSRTLGGGLHCVTCDLERE